MRSAAANAVSDRRELREKWPTEPCFGVNAVVYDEDGRVAIADGVVVYDVIAPGHRLLRFAGVSS
jgi:hypothetical protein